MSTSPSSSNQAAALKTILIVEDDVQLSTTMALGLETYGYRTLCAADAVEGWRLARAHLPDLIISDIDMPGKDGRRLLNEMRADPELSNRQFVLMTGKRDEGNTRQTFNDIFTHQACMEGCSASHHHHLARAFKHLIR